MKFYEFLRVKTTIQGTIEKRLEKIFGEKITLIGQGRIDAGAHALGQVANFKAKKDFKPAYLKKALNSMIPLDIRINDAQIADDKFHSRYLVKVRC